MLALADRMLHHQQQIIVKHSALLWFLWTTIYDLLPHTASENKLRLRRSRWLAIAHRTVLATIPFSWHKHRSTMRLRGVRTSSVCGADGQLSALGLFIIFNAARKL